MIITTKYVFRAVVSTSIVAGFLASAVDDGVGGIIWRVIISRHEVRAKGLLGVDTSVFI